MNTLLPSPMNLSANLPFPPGDNLSRLFGLLERARREQDADQATTDPAAPYQALLAAIFAPPSDRRSA